MGLNQKQQEAVEYLDGPLLVLAGPGTGKTQLLSHKVAYILKNTDTNPENILCLTFTDSGATNMRERLKSIIKKDALKVNIGTYHSFGSEILAAYRNYSDSYDRQLDAAIDEVEQYKIIKTIQDSLSGTDILRGDNVKDIVSTISSAKSANLTADDLAAIADQNIADSEILSRSISPLLQNVVPRKYEESLKNAYQPIYELLKSYTDLPPILNTIDRNINSLARDLKSAILEAAELGKVTPLSDWKDTYFEKDAAGRYRLKDRIANKKLKSLAHVMRAYDQYLKDNHLYDFNDMIIEAVRVLTEDTGFRLTLSEKYQFILLDEFQDTNPSQFEIIKQLTAYEKPMIMAVGDDDQAIYEFQGASATNLTTFQEHYSAHVIGLVENYRSTAEILDFSHEIIAQASDRFADKALIAHLPSPEKSEISRHEFVSSDAEYTYVAEEIARLINSGVHASDIAVIAPKHKYILPLLPYLKSHPEIKIAYEKRDNLLEDHQIRELINLSKFVYALATGRPSEISLLEIMTYPFWGNLGIHSYDIVKVINRARNDRKSALDYCLETDHPAIKRLAHFITDLATRSFEVPLEVFFNYLIGVTDLDGFRSPFLEYYTAESTAYGTFELYENLATLRSKLNGRSSDKSPKLADFVAMIEDYEAAEYPIQSTSPYRDAAESVQLLSAHKAKGLEFEYVFIIAADHVAWGKGKGNNNLLSLPKNLLPIRHTGTTDGERLRLLYVAATRAKRHLIITNSLKDFNGKSPERLEYLDEYIDENGQLVSPFLPTKSIISHPEDYDIDKKITGIKNWLGFFAYPDPEMRAIYAERLENYRLSASALTSFIDVIYGGPQAFFKSNILHAPDDNTSESIIYGNLIHDTFKHVTKDHLSDADAIDYFKTECEKSNTTPEIIANMLEKGVHALEISLQTFGAKLRAPYAEAEVSLYSEHPVVDEVPITGVIDHLEIDEKNKTIEIYDFKTSAYHKEKWTSHPTLYKYMLQLGFYKLLLNNSPTYAKYTVNTGHILFVSPDNDDEVHDKIYEFNAADEKALRELISAVYRQIKSLNFLSDDDLFRPADKSLTIKDIKAFIELVLAKTPLK